MKKLSEYPFQPSLNDDCKGFHLIPADVAAATDAVVEAVECLLRGVETVACGDCAAGDTAATCGAQMCEVKQLYMAKAALDKAGE